MGKIVYNYCMNSDLLLTRLKDLPVPAVRWLESTGSTNDDAAAWAAAGAADGSLVAADLQMGGRGRLGRTWVTRPGGALAFSLIVRLRADEQSLLALFSPLGALAVADALETLALRPEVKWPNDVLLERRKICGILAEAAWIGDELQALVLGIGVNIAPFSVPPAESLLFPAACVEDFLEKPVDRFNLLHQILASFFLRREQIGQPAFMNAWEKHLAFKGEMVTVSPPGENPVRGRLAGVDAQGNLRLCEENGVERMISAGDLTLRPS
jgi:BirA family transcriptional regulator, biotin operon repressor / biotin---[acetyl-CoA-carboxylase] ligase